MNKIFQKFEKGHPKTMKEDASKIETITTVGIVIPVDWEENGKPIAYALSSYEEKEYLIDIRTELGKKLSTIEKQKIRVTGTLGSIVNNRRMISIDSYELSSAES